MAHDVKLTKVIDGQADVLVDGFKVGKVRRSLRETGWDALGEHDRAVGWAETRVLAAGLLARDLDDRTSSSRLFT